MSRINLAIIRKDHLPALSIGRRIPAIRLIAQVCLATAEGWTLFDPAIVDTGAPVCVFPPSLWKSSKYEPMGRVLLGGISKREECRIPAKLATVRCTLSDGTTALPSIEFHAYLAEDDDAPTVIGMLGFIERGVLRVEVARNRATLRLS